MAATQGYGGLNALLNSPARRHRPSYTGPRSDWHGFSVGKELGTKSLGNRLIPRLFNAANAWNGYLDMLIPVSLGCLGQYLNAFISL